VAAVKRSMETAYIDNSFRRLKAYCEKENFKGWDPYDGLNSRILQALPLLKKNRCIRLGWIQFFKRSPYNLRPVFLIEKGYNPKGLALFLSGYCLLYKIERKKEHLETISWLIEKLISMESKGNSGSCWGYNFDWQARAFYQPRYTPSVVVSAFVAQALLDAFDLLGDESHLSKARSTCDFIIKDLNRTYDKDGDFAFSYSPVDKSVVFNASFFASRILARVYSYTQEASLLDDASRSVSFCSKHQRDDGSWGYGLLPYHRWVDSFHTGYILESLWQYEKFSGDKDYHDSIEKGFKYYIDTFFNDKGIPRYYNNRLYPIDVHSTAQLVIVLCALGRLKEKKILADRVLSWTIANMQDEKGFFYYQRRPLCICKIPYMRWSQAWMFYALSSYLKVYE